MSVEITNGIKVSVECRFSERFSSIVYNKYIYQYTISITNKSNFSVQLLEREWFIFDSLDFPRIVRGEGVIGEQPIIEPGDTFSYSSSCDLQSTLGKMEGNYIFQNVTTSEILKVKIPTFQLLYPNLLN
jgi:ApaG protein